MRKMKELKEMLCKELDRITDKGELSASSLDVIDKLTHSIKSIETIIAMNDYSGDDYSRDGYSGRRRDSMGRYSRDYGRAYSERYSGDDMMKLKDELGRLEGSMDGRAKRMIQDWMQDLN